MLLAQGEGWPGWGHKNRNGSSLIRSALILNPSPKPGRRKRAPVASRMRAGSVEGKRNAFGAGWGLAWVRAPLSPKRLVHQSRRLC